MSAGFEAELEALLEYRLPATKQPFQVLVTEAELGALLECKLPATKQPFQV
jgi:hypothetical protein